MFIVLNFKSKFGNETIKSKNSKLIFHQHPFNSLLTSSLKMSIDILFKFLKEYFLFKAELKMN